ncbi:MAG: GNAT family N-acetyltransferase [Oscillospiraceae bacterium]|nr:GNAT family N-acetyltransferase [Oscillospiraceae bacterium]
MNIKIRTATKADIPQLIELYKELIHEEPPIDLDTAAGVLNKAESNDIVYFVAVDTDSERIAATSYIAIIPNMTRRCSPIGFIENVVTAADYRRMGIGRRLFDVIIDYAKERGCYKVTLSSGNARKEAHDFYKSLGFDGESKKTFEMRFNDGYKT